MQFSFTQPRQNHMYSILSTNTISIRDLFLFCCYNFPQFDDSATRFIDYISKSRICQHFKATWCKISSDKNNYLYVLNETQFALKIKCIIYKWLLFQPKTRRLSLKQGSLQSNSIWIWNYHFIIINVVPKILNTKWLAIFYIPQTYWCETILNRFQLGVANKTALLSSQQISSKLFPP